MSSSSLMLASGSGYKRQLLERLGLDFEAEPADIEESRRPDESPAAMARRLAARKATVVGRRHPDLWVLGADQVVALGDRALSKPGTRGKARDQLRVLSGRTHRLTAAIALHDPSGDLLEDAVTFEMEMRSLDDTEIRAYLEEDDPLDCAGSYKIEQGGIRLFSAMRGDDYTAIVGLPLTRVWNILERAEYFEASRGNPDDAQRYPGEEPTRRSDQDR